MSKKPQTKNPPPSTLGLRQLARLNEEGRNEEDDQFYLTVVRPTDRVECRNAARPCPWVSCKYHLYLDVNEDTGSIKLNFPNKEVWELEETCVLDRADKGETTLDEVGRLNNVSRERIRQIEGKALDLLRLYSDPSLDPSNSTETDH